MEEQVTQGAGSDLQQETPQTEIPKQEPKKKASKPDQFEHQFKVAGYKKNEDQGEITTYERKLNHNVSLAFVHDGKVAVASLLREKPLGVKPLGEFPCDEPSLVLNAVVSVLTSIVEANSDTLFQ